MTITLINNYPNFSFLRNKQANFNSQNSTRPESADKEDAFVSSNASNNDDNKRLLFAGITIFLLVLAGILIQKKINSKTEKEFDDIFVNSLPDDV